MSEVDLCPKCGKARIPHPVFGECTCPKPKVTVTMAKPSESAPAPIEAEVEHLGVKYRGTLYPVEE